MAITKASSNAVAPAAKGDLVAGTTTNDSGVLAVGANGTVLTAASGETTGLQWATPVSGSMTSIASGSLSGASVTLSSIVGTYKELKLILTGVSLSGADQVDIRINGDTGATNYAYTFWIDNSTAVTSNGENRIRITGLNMQAADTANTWVLTFPNYTSTTAYKICQNSGFVQTATYTTGRPIFGSGGLRSLSAITSLTALTSGGTFDAGTYILYGVN